MPIAGRDGKSQTGHNLGALAALLTAANSIALVVREGSHAALHGSMAIGGASSEREGILLVKRAVVIHGSKRAVRAFRLRRRIFIARHDARLAVCMAVVVVGFGRSKTRGRLETPRGRSLGGGIAMGVVVIGAGRVRLGLAKRVLLKTR